MAKYFLYGNGGGINKVIEEMNNSPRYFSSIKDALVEVAEEISRWGTPISAKEDLNVCFYGYDKRINKNVYMITTTKYGNEIYSHPVFAKYMVDLEEK